MTDVFISYKSERRPAARHFAKVMRCWGYEAWYDRNLIAGDNFEQRILERLSAASLVIVLWCKRSVKSEWVVREAREAVALGKYLPVRIEDCELPLDLKALHCLNLVTWDGSSRSSHLDRLLDDLDTRTGKRRGLDVWLSAETDEDWAMFGSPTLKSFTLSDLPLRIDLSQQNGRNKIISESTLVNTDWEMTAVTHFLKHMYSLKLLGDGKLRYDFHRYDQVLDMMEKTGLFGSLATTLLTKKNTKSGWVNEISGEGNWAVDEYSGEIVLRLVGASENLPELRGLASSSQMDGFDKKWFARRTR